MGFLLAVWCCGSVAAKECALFLPVGLPKLDFFAATFLPSLALPEYGRSGEVKSSGSHSGVRAGVPLVTLSFRCLLMLDAGWLSCFGRARLPRS